MAKQNEQASIIFTNDTTKEAHHVEIADGGVYAMIEDSGGGSEYWFPAHQVKAVRFKSSDK